MACRMSTMSLLQCGRNFRVAEGAGYAAKNAAGTVLQCGRNFRVAEGIGAGAARIPVWIASMWPQL